VPLPRLAESYGVNLALLLLLLLLLLLALKRPSAKTSPPLPQAAASLALATRLVSPWTGLTYHPSWYRRRHARAEFVLVGRALSVS
jgi:hypothetical protein